METRTDYKAEKSESIAMLAKALSKAQSEMSPAPLNATNPYFQSEYADLGSITETAKPVLAKHGLAVSQFPVSINGAVGVETLLIHESGEWLSQIITIPLGESKNIAQQAGQIITYLRRYGLAAVLGIYAGGDVDAQLPAGKAPDETDEEIEATASDYAEPTMPKPRTTGKAYPAYMIKILVDQELANHEKHAVNILNLFPELPRNTSGARVVDLVKIYQARKADTGKDDEFAMLEAAEIAWSEWNE
jgi:hypothetical protein